MESPPSIETVNQALQALYNSPDVIGKEKASVWLGELQKSVHAWQIADQLLSAHQSLEACYFAAQTMRTKIQYAFHELPANVHQSLRDSLIEHASKITGDTAPVIVTQLSLALADLALQMVTWKNAISDLVQKFGSNTTQLHFLLEVLTVLPEEINSRSLRLGLNRRNEVVEELQNSSQVVLQLLTACFDNIASDVRIRSKVLKCLSSWYSIDAIPESIVESNLLAAPFNTLVSRDCSSNLHEAATDCICNALYCVEDMQSHPKKAEALFHSVLKLADAYHMSVAEEDIDKSLNYCRIFTELAETCLQVILKSPNQGLGSFQTLELLLMCMGHHQYEVAEVTFNFWYKLSEELYQKDTTEFNEVFRPYIQRLIIALCHHCQMDPDHDGVLDPSDDFYDFRLRVSELIKDVIFIVGSSTCFQHMFTNLKTQSSETSWDVSEASLFIMAAVAKNILPEENEVVPQVVQAVLSIPSTAHLAVRFTTLQLLGELCEWIDSHHEVIDPVLQYLLAGLRESRLASVAATALQSISTHCKDHMTTHCEGLIQIAQAVDTFNISNEAATGLLKGVATILATLPHEKCAEGMRQLCSFQTEALNKLLSEGSEKPKQGSKEDPMIWLDRLAAIFRYTTPSTSNGQVHPCQPVIQEVWPVISGACDKYKGDVRIIERCCRCIRFAIRCLGKSSSPLLTPLVSQMVSIYQEFPHSCFLYLGSILVDEYGYDKECTQGLLDMFEALCGPTFKVLEEQNGLRNHPDTVDDLFRLGFRFILRTPVPFLKSPTCKPVLLCAVAACSLDHKDANASVMKFILELLKAATIKEDRSDFEERSALVKGLLQEHGQSLVHSLIHSIIFCLPTYMSADIGEVVFEIMHIDRPTFCVWLETVLKALPTENTGGVISVTHKQLTEFHKAVTSAEKVTPVSDSLREFARLYR